MSDPMTGGSRFRLCTVDDHLELRRGSAEGGASAGGGGSSSDGIWITLPELNRRAAQGGELLRACGAADDVRVLDAMAGWGVDGLVLARRRCRVTMVERQPLLAALQRDLVRRAAAGDRVTCVLGDGFEVLTSPSRWNVVYLDPMFPERGKGALPGKRMQWLAELAHEDARPLAQWIEAAREAAVDRVVLKRRRRDAVVNPPDWQILGRTVRYDVYRGRSQAELNPPAAPHSGSPDQ